MSDIITNLHVWLSFGAKFQNELTAAVHFILKMHLATWTCALWYTPSVKHSTVFLTLNFCFYRWFVSTAKYVTQNIE